MLENTQDELEYEVVEEDATDRKTDRKEDLVIES